MTRLRDFFAALFFSGFIELRALALPGVVVDRRFFPASDPTPAKQFLAAHKAKNIFFGVAARRDGSGGDLGNCLSLRALFGDLDFKDLPEAEARARLARFPLPPSIVVASGGGLHVYWLLREPAELPAEAVRTKDLLRRLARELDGDLNAAEPAHVFRVPWTRNFKYDPPRLVTIELFEPDRRYNLAEFDWLLPEDPSGDGQGSRFTLPAKIPEGRVGADARAWIWANGRIW